MDAVLVKRGEIYFLEKAGFNDLETIGNSIKKPKGDLYDLSISNCKEIELDIDLNKIKKDYIQKRTSNYDADTLDKYLSFIEEDANEFINGFVLGLELLNKKNIDSFAKFIGEEECRDFSEYVEPYTSSQERNKWDVVLVTEPMDLDEIREQGKGFLNGNINKPKLDSKGCLILKIK